MIQIQTHNRSEKLRIDIEELISRHGRWRILVAAAAGFLRRHRPFARPGVPLSRHLRRDIGLPDAPPPPLPHRIGPML